jgi:hypothetical protein
LVGNMQLALIVILWIVAAGIVIGIGYVNLLLGFLAMFPVYWASSRVGERIIGVRPWRRPRQQKSPDQP